MNAVEKYETRVTASGSLVCVGLDSDLARLPERFRAEKLPQFAFNRWLIDQTAAHCAAFKLNMAFYEARGLAGMAELEMTIAHLRENHPDLFTICDAKRGDIGDTSAAYARAVFDTLGFDAVTLNPYMGRESLSPFLDRADRASIILCRTSNPGSGEFQNLEFAGRPLWQHVAETVAEKWNAHGNCMLVVGATRPEELQAVRGIIGDMNLLVPGVGAQGADATTVVRLAKNSKGRGLIINSSRAIMFAKDPAEAVKSHNAEIQAALA